MPALNKLKRFIKENIAISYPSVHFRKTLRNFDLQELDFRDLDSIQAHFLVLEGRELTEVYKNFIANSWDRKAVEKIKDDDVCIFIVKDGAPIACTLLNLNGKGLFRYPFDYHFDFGEKHSYGFALFVKEEFRNKGLAKALHYKQFQICKEQAIKFCNRFIVSHNQAPLHIAEKFGYERLEEWVLVKFFNFKTVLMLDTEIKKILFYKIKSSAKKIYKIFPQINNLANLFLSTLKATLLTCKTFFSIFFPKVYILKGKAKNSNEDLSAIFIGKSPMHSYYKHRFFAAVNVEQPIRTIPLFAVKKELRRSKDLCDIFLVNGYFLRFYQWLFKKDRSAIFMPNYVAQINDSFIELSDFKSHHNAYEDIRKAKKYNYECEFSRSPAALTFFYEHMYLPYVKNRFDDEQIVLPFKKIKKIFNAGGLLLLKHNGSYLSASVVSLKNNIFHPNHSGLINGDLSLLERDVSSSMYYHYFRLAEELKCPVVDLGLSRPFLDDGVLQYKKKWNTKISYDSKRTNFYICKINRYTLAVKNFLINNPFISLQKGGLIGNVFSDSLHSLDIDEAYKKYYLNGMKQLKIKFFEPPTVIGFTAPVTTASGIKLYLKNQGRVLVLDAELRQSVMVTQSLGRQGIAVSCLSSKPFAPSFYSKYCSERIWFKEIQDPRKYAEFIEYLVKKRRYELVVTSCDYSTEIISPIRERILPYSRVFLPKDSIIRIVTSKYDLTKFSLEQGIPVPKTVFPSGLSDVLSLDGQLSYPIVVKGDKTTGAQKVRYAHNKKELIARFKEISQIDSRPIVQEFIKGRHRTFYGLCENGEVIAYFMFEGTRSYPPSGGTPIRAYSVYNEKLKQISFKFIKATNWNGVLGINFKQDIKTGEYYLLDCNPRFCGTMPLAARSGVDLPYLLFKLAVEGKREYTSQYKTEKYRTLFKEDTLYAFKRPWAIPRLLLEFLEPNVYYGFEKEDPLPFIYLAKNTKWAVEEAIKNKMKRLLR